MFTNFQLKLMKIFLQDFTFEKNNTDFLWKSVYKFNLKEKYEYKLLNYEFYSLRCPVNKGVNPFPPPLLIRKTL